MNRSTCRSCGAPILWALTTTGKRMPLDAEPSEDGSYTLGDDEIARHEPQRLAPRHKSHFATCPNAAAHRKPQQ